MWNYILRGILNDFCSVFVFPELNSLNFMEIKYSAIPFLASAVTFDEKTDNLALNLQNLQKVTL